MQILRNTILCSIVCVNSLTFVNLLHKDKKREVRYPLLTIWKSLISPYISEMNATEKRDTIPVTCSTSISLSVSVTTIAESTMLRQTVHEYILKLDTTIGCHMNLSIMKCCCLVDLLLDDLKGVHSRCS